LLLVRQVGFEFLNYFMQQTSRKRIRDLLFHGTKTCDLSLYFLFASVHAVRRGNSSSCFGGAKLFILACTGRCDPNAPAASAAIAITARPANAGDNLLHCTGLQLAQRGDPGMSAFAPLLEAKRTSTSL